MTATIKISSPMASDEREIRVGDHVAYGQISDDGRTYSVNHAPTQDDFDAVSAVLDEMSARDIKAALPKESRGTVYVVRDASGEYLRANGGRTPASNEAVEFESRDDATAASERATDKVLSREIE